MDLNYTSFVVHRKRPLKTYCKNIFASVALWDIKDSTIKTLLCMQIQFCVFLTSNCFDFLLLVYCLAGKYAHTLF